MKIVLSHLGFYYMIFLINNKKFNTVKKRVSTFREYEKLFEAVEIDPSKLRGYPADQMVKRIEELMEIMPDRTRFGVPADIKGFSTSYRDANGAIQKIQDIDHYYSGKGEDVRFYCWSISYAGSWDATKSLREKIDQFGGFGREQNMNLKRVIDYFKKNPEDVDNVRSISISVDSKSIRKNQMSQSEPEEMPANPQDQQESDSAI